MKHIGFFMNQIAVNQFAILVEEPPLGELPLDMGIQFKIDTTNKNIAVAFKIQFSHNGSALLLMEVQCGFAVRPEDWDDLVKGDTIVFPVEFIRHISLHTVGTARGVLFCKTEGTPFNRFILPPVNLETLINQELKMPLAK